MKKKETYPLGRDLSPLDTSGARHHDLVCGLTAGVFFQGLRCSRGVQIRAAAIAARPQVEVEDKEGLSAEAGSQALQSGQVLIHDFLGAESALAHCVLLESAHKFGEHSADA